MVKIFRFNHPPLDVTIDSIRNIYYENHLLHICLKSGEEIVGYNVVF